MKSPYCAHFEDFSFTFSKAGSGFMQSESNVESSLGILSACTRLATVLNYHIIWNRVFISDETGLKNKIQCVLKDTWSLFLSPNTQHHRQNGDILNTNTNVNLHQYFIMFKLAVQIYPWSKINRLQNLQLISGARN